MAKYKHFNKETLAEALQILQPVSPTDPMYQAHYYNEGLGHKIMTEQKNFLRSFKKVLSDCNTKEDIKKAIESHGIAPKWPPYINEYASTDHELMQSNHRFWTEGFGSLIRKEWFNMIIKFIDHVNSLK